MQYRFLFIHFIQMSLFQVIFLLLILDHLVFIILAKDCTLQVIQFQYQFLKGYFIDFFISFLFIFFRKRHFFFNFLYFQIINNAYPTDYK